MFFIVFADIISVFGAMMALPPYITKAKAGHLMEILKMQKSTEIGGGAVPAEPKKAPVMDEFRPNPRFTASNSNAYPVGTPPPP